MAVQSIPVDTDLTVPLHILGYVVAEFIDWIRTAKSQVMHTFDPFFIICGLILPTIVGTPLKLNKAPWNSPFRAP